jgi:predicted MFS family arabinose efflux permease
MDDKRRWQAGWTVVAAAALLLAVAQGFRAALGLFVSPINTATGLGLATISFALGASQLASGLAQPLAGNLAERYGTARLVALGAAGSAAVIAALPWLGSTVALTTGMVLLAVMGTAFASPPVMMAAIIERVPASHRGRASGLVGAGGSLGQLAIGPAAQAGIAHAGWIATLYGLAGLTLVSGALAACFRGASATRVGEAAPIPADVLRSERRAALADRNFWLLAGSFFACGFHVSFLLAHMPAFIAACGLPPSLSGAWLAIIGVCNVAGSIGAGYLIERVSPRATLAVLYALRGAIVLAFVTMPPSPESVLAFSVAVGITYMATLPPTTALVGSLFGARNVAVLFGLVMLLHQVGSFLGVWVGGLVFDATGSYTAMWLVDGALALGAAAAVSSMRERASDQGARRILPGSVPKSLRYPSNIVALARKP